MRPDATPTPRQVELIEADDLSGIEEFHAEIRGGKRCYDCGERFEQPLRMLPNGEPDLTDETAIDQGAFDRANPSHTECFK